MREYKSRIKIPQPTKSDLKQADKQAKKIERFLTRIFNGTKRGQI